MISLTIFVLLVLSLGLQQELKVETDYKTYILDTLENEGQNNYEQAIKYVKEKLQDETLSLRDVALNLLARDSYYYLNNDYELLLDNFLETEELLIENEMIKEVIYLYSLVSSVYLKQYNYDRAYLYINEAEMKSIQIYEKTQDEEVLSTLLAIMYLKANLGLTIGLEEEANQTFRYAEALRNQQDSRPRLDSYINILKYYYQKDEFDQVITYGLETLDYIATINGGALSELYESDIILINTMLATAYLETGDMTKCLAIVNELQAYQDVINQTDSMLSELNRVYAAISLENKQYEQAIEYLTIAYETLIPTENAMNKVEIINQILDVATEYEVNVDLIYWYELWREESLKEDELMNRQLLLSQIIDSEYNHAKVEIEMLEVSKQIDLMEQAGLIIILLIILNQVRLLRKRNRIDSLTGVYNRNYFNYVYGKYIKQKKSHYVIIFDVDNFKALNDTYGHTFGDHVLAVIGKELKKIKTLHVKPFRYGGEEFVLIVDNLKTEEVTTLAETIRKLISQLKFENNVTVTISAGVSQSTNEFKNTLEDADRNLYHSKHSGKNKVTFK